MQRSAKRGIRDVYFFVSSLYFFENGGSDASNIGKMAFLSKHLELLWSMIAD